MSPASACQGTLLKHGRRPGLPRGSLSAGAAWSLDAHRHGCRSGGAGGVLVRLSAAFPGLAAVLVVFCCGGVVRGGLCTLDMCFHWSKRRGRRGARWCRNPRRVVCAKQVSAHPLSSLQGIHRTPHGHMRQNEDTTQCISGYYFGGRRLCGCLPAKRATLRQCTPWPLVRRDVHRGVQQQIDTKRWVHDSTSGVEEGQTHDDSVDSDVHPFSSLPQNMHFFFDASFRLHLTHVELGEAQAWQVAPTHWEKALTSQEGQENFFSLGVSRLVSG
jgi:hypothetical protein